MKTLIGVGELQAKLGAGGWFIFDCRFSLADPQLGRRQFEESHIPGAQYADLNRDLSGPVIAGTTGRHPLPSRDVFVATVRRWGVTRDAQIVVYDDAGGAMAARLWWMFRWLGHEHVAVLDGGFPAWVRHGYSVTADSVEFSASDFNAGEPLTRTVEADELLNADMALIDARDEARYRGEVEPIDPVAGHIPGAICAPFTDNLYSTGEFKSPDELAARFSGAGIPDDKPGICYCGSGVTATHNILAMVHGGLPEPALYPGSWSEWITDPARPIERS